MKRVIIDARESGTSTGRYVDKLIEYLHKLKPGYEIIILAKPHRIDFFKTIAVNFRVLESPYKEFTFSEQIGLLRQIKSLRPDLVHFSMTQQPGFYNGKVVTTIHDLTTARFNNPAKNKAVFKTKQIIYRWLIKKVARKSLKLIVASEFVKADVAQYTKINPEKIKVIYEAAGKIEAAPKPITELSGKKFIMYVGRALPHKNLNRLIDAFSIIKKTHPDLNLALAGQNDANYELLKKYARAKYLTSQVFFTGLASDSQLRWLYENTAAYVFPSLSEGFGLPGVEAMTHGAPVVSSNASCLPEIYGDAAHYFNPLDTDDMAAKISEVLDNFQLSTNLIARGHAQAAKYSWAKTATQTLEIYKSVLS